MKKCDKCDGSIPRYIWVDGVRKYSSVHRRFCFDCSPWGSHNTRSLEKKKSDGKNYPERICPECGKTHKKRGWVCQACVFKKKIEKNKKELKCLVGDSCWICNYNKCQRSLCFHHVNPEDKKIGLTIREIAGFSKKIIDIELRKCIMVCHNCHGEIHDGLISEEIVIDLWRKNWYNIDNKMGR